MKLLDTEPHQQKWASAALLVLSSAAIFSIVGRSEPIGGALGISVCAFAIALPALALGLWTYTFIDKNTEVGLAWGALYLVGLLSAFVGMTALIWALHPVAGGLFLVLALIANAIGTLVNRRAGKRSR